MDFEFNIDTQLLGKEIAQEVVKGLKPFLKVKGDDDVIFNVDGLAGYLKTSKRWVMVAVKRELLIFSR